MKVAIGIMLLGLSCAATFGQSAADDVAASQHVGQAARLGNDDAYRTMEGMIGSKKYDTFNFYVVSQTGQRDYADVSGKRKIHLLYGGL